MQCPRCQSTLAESVENGVPIDRCPSCAVVFFDTGELGQVLGRPGIERALVHASDADVPAGACPRCSEDMFGAEVAGIEVDICSGCSGMIVEGFQVDEATSESTETTDAVDSGGLFTNLFAGIRRLVD